MPYNATLYSTWDCTTTATSGTFYYVGDCSTATVAYDDGRDRIRREQQRCNEERAKPERAVAYEKAERWLTEHLNDEQRETYQREQFFDVIGGKTRKRYRVRRGLSGVHNVQEMKRVNGEWRRARTLCFHPAGDLPEGDILLTQKALLENCEERVLKVANFS